MCKFNPNISEKNCLSFYTLVPHSNAVFGASIKIKTRLQQGEAKGAQRESVILAGRRMASPSVAERDLSKSLTIFM